MKKVILLALLMPLTAYGQIVENFEPGNLNNWVQSTEGHWKADTASAISGSFSLHHIFDNPDAGNDRIAFPLQNLHPSKGPTTWSFVLRHGSDPSSSNNWAVFLMSDAGPASMSVSGGTNGFAIGVNITGTDDTLRLVKVKGGLLTTIVDCRINWQTAVGVNDPVKIIAERNPEGNWTITVRRLNGDLAGISYGADSELFNISWMGICYNYSSTRDRVLWVDDITVNGTFHEDDAPPFISGSKITGRNSVEISFSESLSDQFMIPENISMNSTENKAVLVEKKNDFTYRVTFPDILNNKTTNSLIINKICDNSGNCALNIRIAFNPVWAEPGDVVISEIMADPAPAVSLPSVEYIEVTNRTDYPFNLKNWKLKADHQSYSFDETIIGPRAIIIACFSGDTSLFMKYGHVTGLKQFPVLTDGGKIICLADSSETLIHGVEYTPDWYGDVLKSGGGWSLEMIDIAFPFFAEGNWTASVSRNGGSPGEVNSVSESNPDDSFYGIQNIFPQDSINIVVRFSEPLLSFQDLADKIKIPGKHITDIFPTDPLFREFIVRPDKPLARGEIYQIEFSEDVMDFAGNIMQKVNFTFGLAEPAETGDILFNELLFNPLPGDPDYIELYNSSENVIDASRLQLVSESEVTGDKSQIYPVSEEKRCILPGSYFAVTTNRNRVLERYYSCDPDHLFKSGDLPTMPDDKGYLILYDRELDRIDEVSYNEKMHFSLLSGFEGVALEKTGPDLKSSDAVNWHSATESSGWGTPGAPNSVFSVVPVTTDKVFFSSSKITPDNDGYEDFLVISINLKGNANVISVTVFDEAGNYVKKIASNLLAGPEASLIWDGTAEDGTLVNTGIYIVFINLYDDTGKTSKWKKVCTVLNR